MRKWKYKIKGEKLRELINGNVDNWFEILIEIKEILSKMEKLIIDIDDDHDFDNLKGLISDDVEIGKIEMLEYLNSEGIEISKYIDYRLSDMYNLLDDYDIWLTI